MQQHKLTLISRSANYCFIVFTLHSSQISTYYLVEISGAPLQGDPETVSKIFRLIDLALLSIFRWQLIKLV